MDRGFLAPVANDFNAQPLKSSSCAPGLNFAKRSGAGKGPWRKIADWPRLGTYNPPRHLDCARFADEND